MRPDGQDQQGQISILDYRSTQKTNPVASEAMPISFWAQPKRRDPSPSDIQDTQLTSEI